MNITDLEYGKVLVTGEIAFYMQHPKGRMITEENKEKFLNKWLKNRIKYKKDKSDVRKVLQQVRNSKSPVTVWERNANAYLTHVRNCNKIKKLGKKDRELIDEAVAEMRAHGYHSRTGVNPTDEITDEEAERFADKGAFLMMDILENRFEDGTLKKGVDVEFIATNQEVVKHATQIFLRKSFPLKFADRNDIFCVGSAQGQINTTLASVN